MTSIGEGEGPIRRFDPSWIVGEVNQRTPYELAVTGTAELGESGGAVFVRWPDGRDGVVTSSQGTPFAHLQLTSDVLQLARSRGLPVPHIDGLVPVADGIVAIVQERLPGHPMGGRLDPASIHTLISVNEQCTALLSDRHDVPVPAMNLRSSGTALPRFGIGDHSWHEVLAGHSVATRELLAQIKDIGTSSPDKMAGDDLLQMDLNGDNVLLGADGRVTGLVDWNWGVARGDRALPLVRLRVTMAWGTLNPQVGADFYSAMELLDCHLVETVDTALLRMYSAHAVLHELSWAVRHWPAHVVDAFVRTGQAMLGKF